MATVEQLMTIEEYARLPNNGRPTELVRGRVIEMYLPIPRHGQICIRVGRLIANYAYDHDLGEVVGNNAGVVTERNPDSLRGADIAFYSYARVLRGPMPARGYLDVTPELVIEVRSPDDRWAEILEKVAEFLNAGVQVVCVLDDDTRTARVYTEDQPEQVFQVADELSFPKVLEGFRVQVRKFFE